MKKIKKSKIDPDEFADFCEMSIERMMNGMPNFTPKPKRTNKTWEYLLEKYGDEK